MTDAKVDTVQAWHAALNSGDTEGVLALSSADMEVGGPRGSGRGADLLRDWIGRAGVRLEPRRTFSGDHAVVVEQLAQWRTETGELTEPQVVASVFRVRDGKVESVIRHADLASALESAGVDPSPAG
jgi:ketosteroid isomerase-like protein